MIVLCERGSRRQMMEVRDVHEARMLTGWGWRFPRAVLRQTENDYVYVEDDKERDERHEQRT